MFSKPQAKTPTPVSTTPTPEAPVRPKVDPMPSTLPPTEPMASARKPTVASLVAENMTLEGSLSGDGELHVDGTVKGDVRVSRMSIGESGAVDGTITAEAIEVRGKVTGAITAKQVRLYASAVVDGDISHEQLAMEVGASFQGRSMKLQRAATTPAAIAAPREAPKPAAAPEPNRDGASPPASH